MNQSLWTTRSVRSERERVQRLDDPRLATTAPLSEQYKRHALFHNPSLGPTTNTKLHFSALKAPKTAKRKLGRWQTPDGWRTDNDASAAHDETQQDDCSECSDERTEDGNSASNDGNAGANQGNARADEPHAAKKPNSANSQAESPCQVRAGLTKQMEQLLTLNEGPVCLRVSTDPPTFVMQSTQVVPVLPVSCCRDIHSPFSPSATLLQRHTLSSLSFRNTPPATYTLLSLLAQHFFRDVHSPLSPSVTLLLRHTLSSISFSNTPPATYTLLSLLPQHSSRDIHSPFSPSATLLPRHTRPLSSLSFLNTPPASLLPLLLQHIGQSMVGREASATTNMCCCVCSLRGGGQTSFGRSADALG